MRAQDLALQDLDVEQVELRGFSRSAAELEWLLLALVLLYFVVPGVPKEEPALIVGGMVAYASFVLGFRYLNFYERDSRWKLALETWVMIAFITWVLWFTGKVQSPLLNVYLLVIITSALTLGKLMTLLEVGLITACYLYMGAAAFPGRVVSLETFSQLMSNLSPFLLVAYLTTMLSADMQYAKRQVKLISETDELTGLPNMRAFRGILEREIAIAMRYSVPLSVLMVDADGLKEVNDRFGHEAGNRLIRMVAATVQECLRGADVLARYGGDEFVVLLPRTAGEEAREAAVRINRAVREASLDLHGHRLSVTVSLGVASFPADGSSARELLDRADRALYRSKRAGRDRVSRFSED